MPPCRSSAPHPQLELSEQARHGLIDLGVVLVSGVPRGLLDGDDGRNLSISSDVQEVLDQLGVPRGWPLVSELREDEEVGPKHHFLEAVGLVVVVSLVANLSERLHV